LSPLRKVKSIRIVTLSLRGTEPRCIGVEVLKCATIQHIHSSTPLPMTDFLSSLRNPRTLRVEAISIFWKITDYLPCLPKCWHAGRVEAASLSCFVAKSTLRNDGGFLSFPHYTQNFWWGLRMTLKMNFRSGLKNQRIVYSEINLIVLASCDILVLVISTVILAFS
jgi:hypothetical protein